MIVEAVVALWVVALVLAVAALLLWLHLRGYRREEAAKVERSGGEIRPATARPGDEL